eukprot:151347-Rhodomonas_salina.2
MFAALAGGADKVDITKMVHAISPPTSMADYFKKVCVPTGSLSCESGRTGPLRAHGTRPGVA